MPKTLDLKSTVNLPQTSFPMKANLPKNEPVWLEKWARQDLYGAIRRARAEAPLFTLHDGPPYANGRIHLGTALNKLLKDLIVKSKTMAGLNAPFLPGWDCHGLPIEHYVDKELGPRRAQMSAVEIRQACRRYAEKYLGLQREDFKRLGNLGEWEHPYLTMSPEYEAATAEALLKFLEQGYIYRGLKPVYWCIRDRTALAEAEVEYENHRSRSIYVRYRLSSDPAALDPALKERAVWVIIWTTTPWTLPASMAVAFHPDFEYVAAAASLEASDVYLVEARRLQPVLAETGLELGTVLARIPGSRLEHAEFQHPFLDRKVVGVVADYVTAEDGTGAVHTAPGHGREDFETGVRYGLEIYNPVGERGEFIEGLPEYRGKKVFGANEPIVELLRARGALVGAPGWLDHSYPHCWRCHQPVIFRTSNQWFVEIDHDRLRERTLAEIHRVRWSPEWGEERIANMVATRPDWCISRQRVWGVPITVFHCDACGKPLMDAGAAGPAIELFRKEGADAWFTHPVEDLIQPGSRCDCGGTNFSKEMDILDVWFDSGSSQFAVLGHRPDLPWPADVYIEGGDQHRGWFQSSLLVSMITRGAAPYREVLTVGWTLDALGRAMSKSLGNGIDPNDVIRSHGAEILRLWVSSVDFREDVVLSPQILDRLSEAYRKLRNTFRYCLANLYDYDPERHAVDPEALEEIDAWALDRAATVLAQVDAAYQEYAFHKVYRALYDFATVDLSAFYFDILKDRLYTAPADSARRRAAQWTLYRIADALARAMAPMLSFTADEVWSHLPAAQSRESSVHVATFVSPEDIRKAVPERYRDRLAHWPRLIAIRDEVLKALEVARQEKRIGSGLEAKVYLEATGDQGRLLGEYRDFLRYLFIVSQVELTHPAAADGGEGPGKLSVRVERASGEKCARCWNYSERVGEDSEYPTVCERCSAALGEIEAAA
jgi:isoleucyl-tRNA synthetase